MLSVSRSLARGLSLARPELCAIRGMATSAGGPTQENAPASQQAKPVVDKSFLVYRWNPDSSEAPKYQEYKVDINA